MNKIISITTLLVLFITTANAQVDGEVWYKPPFLPFSISWSTDDGFSIKAERSVNTPYGTFGLGVSGGLSKKDENTVQVPSTNTKPIYIEVPKYIDRTKIVEKPVFQIKTIEKIVTKIVENKTYIVELRGYKGKASQEFIIKGIDVFLVEVEGKTKIEAREGRIIIDVSESNVNKIMFRGVSLGEEDKNDKITKLCQKYNTTYGMKAVFDIEDITERYYVNEKYINDYGRVEERSVPKYNVIGKDTSIIMYGFLIYSHYKNLINYKTNFEDKRNLIKKYYIDKFSNQPIARFRDFFITTDGIGMPVKRQTYKKNLLGKQVVDEVTRKNEFFSWHNFVTLTFSDINYEGEKKPNKLYARTAYGEVFEIEYKRMNIHYNTNFINNGFTNVELIQFFKELNQLIVK